LKSDMVKLVLFSSRYSGIHCPAMISHAGLA
jgi:hypothetical protein